MRSVAATLVLAICGTASAHPFAVTLTEVEVNAKERRLEVAMRVYPEQLERGLSRAAGKNVSIESDDDIDKRIAEYLARHFAVLPPASEERQEEKPSKEPDVPKMKWVGKEVTPKGVWLYFEIPHEGPLAGSRIRDTMLLEINPEQVNTVILVEGDRTATCVLDRTTREATIVPRPKEKRGRSGVEVGK